jgi:hypothetical protein
LALKGYDPVAYFTDGKPTEASATTSSPSTGTLSLRHARHPRAVQGQSRQVRAAVRRAVRHEPARAACAADSDPHLWVISNGNLYVFAGETGAADFAKDAEATPPGPPAQLKTLKTQPVAAS